ncbi:7821_t:CDS:2 [Cetraspora pellucida]|uniref:7821_t:CDS:1 n=1 Tax=Cetraspora pellucida TaxID=1433469 RepID=A0ACA9KH93_9GLOM|nr:7821_t:CDS:2 [Cetraspora pellucida]
MPFHPLVPQKITSYTILPPPIVQWHSHGEGNYGPHTLKKSTLNLVSKKSKPLNSTLGFDNIYVTNVSERPAISQTNFDELKNFSPSSELQPLQKAHYLSHYKIYQSIVDHRYDSALILEDDIDFELNIVSIMTDTHRNLPADWEILYLGHCSELEGATNELLLDNSDISAEFKLFKSKRPYCTHAYAVSYVGALKMLQKLGKPTKFPIDIELVHMVEQGVITSYTIVPPVISQWRISESSDMYPGRKTLDLLFLKNSTLYSLGLTHESNSTLGFGHIYVVNLPSRPDRREKLEILANKFNLKFDFVPAVSKDSEEAYVPPGRPIGPTHKACYLSHYKIYKSIDEHKYESALILEDDVDIELNIAYIITNVHKVLPSDWDIFYLGFCSNWEGGGDPIEDKDNISPSHKLFHSRHPYCTHAYALSRTGIRKLLEKLSDEPDSPIDLELISMIGDKKLISYTVMPPLFIQWRSPHNPSDISPGSRALDFYFLKTSALHFIGLLRESNTTLGFNQIYAINKPNRKDRRDKLDSLSTRLYFDLNIVDAVAENDTKKLDEFSPKSQLKPSEKAVYFDHYNVYKSIIDSKYGSALILEDDIDIELNISPIMTDVHQSLPSDWEMLYLGHCNNLEGKSSEPIIVKNKDNGTNYKLFKSKKPYCTYAYAVSHAGALKLLETVGKPTTLPLDQELVNMIQAGKIKSYTLIPPIIVHWQFPNESPESSKVKSSDETSDFYTLTNSTIKFIG